MSNKIDAPVTAIEISKIINMFLKKLSGTNGRQWLEVIQEQLQQASPALEAQTEQSKLKTWFTLRFEEGSSVRGTWRKLFSKTIEHGINLPQYSYKGPAVYATDLSTDKITAERSVALVKVKLSDLGLSEGSGSNLDGSISETDITVAGLDNGLHCLTPTEQVALMVQKTLPTDSREIWKIPSPDTFTWISWEEAVDDERISGEIQTLTTVEKMSYPSDTEVIFVDSRT